MKTTCLTLLYGLLASSACAYYPSAWPWSVEKPNGVELEGELYIDGNTYITSFGCNIRCIVKRDPVLKKEWMFDDEPPSYDWQEPLDENFKYAVSPSGNFVTITQSFMADSDARMTLHARQRRSTHYYDKYNFQMGPSSHAYSYGEVELRISNL